MNRAAALFLVLLLAAALLAGLRDPALGSLRERTAAFLDQDGMILRVGESLGEDLAARGLRETLRRCMLREALLQRPDQGEA